MPHKKSHSEETPAGNERTTSPGYQIAAVLTLCVVVVGTILLARGCSDRGHGRTDSRSPEMPFDATRRPVVTANSLRKTVEPLGVSRRVAGRWLKAIAATLNQKGRCIAVIPMKGNAAGVFYRVEGERVSHAFRMLPTSWTSWDRGDYDVVLSQIASSIRVYDDAGGLRMTVGTERP